MNNNATLVLKTDANCTWIAVPDPASGSRGRYTVYRIYLRGDKRAEIVGREVGRPTARRIASKG